MQGTVARPWRPARPQALQARPAQPCLRPPSAPSTLRAALVTRRAARLPPRAQAHSAGGAGSSGLPYGEALLQREYELWQRQTELYERLQEQHAADLARFAADRAAWQATEAALRAEAAELRAQLMYVLAQMGAAGQVQGGGPLVGGMASPGTGFSPAGSQQGMIAGRDAAGVLPGFTPSSPSSSSSSSSVASSPGPLSPGQQVQAVIEAMKPRRQQQRQDAASSTSGNGSSSSSRPGPATPAAAGSRSSTVSPSDAWPTPPADGELPPYAADLAAAVAAVDSGDVLAGIAGYSLGARRPASPAPAEEQEATSPSQPAAPPAAAAAAAAAPAPAAKEEVPAAAAVAPGPPPAMTLGADDIFWVNQLHTSLVDLGYYPGDEDIDDFYFGPDTQSALMTMQCCEGLPETGITDEATWARLLGPELTLKASRDLTADMMVNVPGMPAVLGGASSSSGSTGGDTSSSAAAAQQAGAQAEAAPVAKPYAELFSAAFTETVGPAPGGGLQDVQQLTVADTVAAGGKVESVQVSSTIKEVQAYTDWPVLHEGDGGREVHAMHVALTRAGYYPSEDDERWWSFGDGTVTALKTFQACNGYPESGVCDAATWRMLLGEDADPNEILELRSGDSADEDLSSQSSDRVWLMGEQRWEDRSRLKKGK